MQVGESPDPMAPSVRRGPGLRAWLADGLLVALLALGLYWPSLDHPFVFDDLQIVVENEHVHEGDLATIASSGYWDGFDPLLGEQQALWRPLTVLTYAWSWSLSGQEPSGFRLANLLLHAATSLVVLGLLSRILRSRGGALAGALLFAAHPIQTEAVTYVAGRADLLAAFGFLAAWLVFLWIHERRGPGRWLLYGLSLTLFALGLLAKEMAATLPAVLVLFDGVARLRGGDGLRAACRATLRRWPLYAGYFLVLGGYLFLRLQVLGALGPDADFIKERANPLASLGALERLDDALGILGRELALLVVPHPLSVDYSFDAIPASAGLVQASSLPWALLAVAALAFALIAFVQRRALLAAAALLFFFGTLFPISNLAFVIGTNLGERALYLVSFAPALAFGAAAAWVTTRWSARAAAPIVAIFLALAAWGTVARNRDYASAYRLFEAAAEAYPRASRAHFNFGIYASRRAEELRDAGEGDTAREELERAREAFARTVEIDPSYTEAHYELGRLAQLRGDHATAVLEFEAVLRSGPEAQRMPGAVTGFAGACIALGRQQHVRGVLAREVAGRESLRLAHELALGLVAASLGEDEAARRRFERVLVEPEPEDDILRGQRLRARVEFARVLGRLGEDARARDLFERAIAEDPASLGAHLSFVEFLSQSARFEEAEAALAQAAKHLGAHPALALARVDLGSAALARVLEEEVTEAEARRLLELADSTLGAAVAGGMRRAGLRFDHARARMALGHWREAAEALRSVAARGGSRAAEAAALAGECHLALGEHERARAAWRDALAVDAQLVTAHRGIAYLDALATGSTASLEALDDDDPRARARLAQLLGREAERREEAFQLARNAHREAWPGHPDFVLTGKVLAELEELEGRYGEARSLRHRLRAWAPEDRELGD